MDAPTYPPAAAFEQPVASSYVWRLEDVSLAELMNNPAARDIVLKHLPSLKQMVGSPMMKPHLGNMTVPSLAAFGRAMTPEEVAAVDAELARLPRGEGSSR